MSLSRDSLRYAMSDWFSTPSRIASPQQAEAVFAQVYHDYAKEGEDVSGERAANLSKKKFQNQLDFQRSRTARDFCRQVDAAFVAYWVGTTFSIGVVPPPSAPCPNIGGTGIFLVETFSGVVGVAAGAMFAALYPIVSVPGGTPRSKAFQMASAMDSVTKKAVTVLITGLDTTPGPTGPLPITNTCTVF